MNVVDIVIAIILVFGAFKGYRNGLFVELASLVGLIAGIFGAIHFSYFAANYLVEKTAWSEHVINLAAFAITFVIIVFVISLAGKALTKIADFAMLGIVNKLVGAAFAIVKYAFLLSVVLMFLDAANRQVGIVSEESIEESVLYSPIRVLAPTVLPSILEEAEKRELYQSDSEQ